MGKKKRNREENSSIVETGKVLNVNDADVDLVTEEDVFDETNEYLDGDKLNATFSLEPIVESDFISIKDFVKNLLIDTSYNSGDLTDIIIAERENCGSVITVEGQDDVFGLMTVINVHKYKTRPSIQSILKYVKSKVGNSSQANEWKKILDDENERIALIISERILNVPNQLAPHINTITLEEATKMEKFTYYLLISDYYKEVKEVIPQSKKSKTSSSSSSYDQVDNSPHYPKIEDEIYRDSATLYHSIRVIRNNLAQRWTLRMLTQQTRMFLLISQDKISHIITKLKKLSIE